MEVSAGGVFIMLMHSTLGNGSNLLSAMKQITTKQPNPASAAAEA